MRKEFTGPRYHKGWETLFYSMSIMTSVLSDRPAKRHTFLRLHVHILYSEYPPTMQESTWIWRRKFRRSVYSRRTERWELGWRILTFRNTPKKEIFLYISTFGREATMRLPSDEATYSNRTEPSISLLREPPKFALLLTNYLLYKGWGSVVGIRNRRHAERAGVQTPVAGRDLCLLRSV